ncbi:uncharacterized protein LOC107839476 isoform X1 [Capsicum annuum]|uniref:uncharacterized protein LOC107839476 isoform X1 n=1 Tax=Capsicum annuum TaxID=4072 RepID=UPI001FB1936E|nr:uncharacterized protein LOC107839476 isoform X1 [Capsicum annuum]
MAAAPFLLGLNVKRNPLLYTTNPILQYTRFPYYQNLTLSKPSKLTVKCFTKNHKNLCFNDKNGLEIKCNEKLFDIVVKRVENELEIKNKENPFDIIVESVKKALKALEKPAVVAVFVGLFLMYAPNSAFAASGGRMGGSSFSSSRSSSSSSRSSSSSSWSSPWSSESSYSSRVYTLSTSEPSVSYSVSYSSSSLFWTIVDLLLYVIVLAAVISVVSFPFIWLESVLADKTHLLKLQVGLLGLGRSLQKDLNQIAEVADTSTPEGLSYVLTETTLALLRHPDYCISAYSSVDVKRSMEEGEKRFNQLSIEERGKFDEETLVNVNNIRRKSSTSQRANGFSNEYIVVTILVAAEGAYKLPTVNGSGDLKEALQKIASIPSSKILAVEILWTPQNEYDTLSERELLEDYPLLRPL